MYKCLWWFFLISAQITVHGGQLENDVIEIDLSHATAVKRVKITSNSSMIIRATNLPSNVTSVLFQAHVQRNNITLSFLESITFHKSVTGKNIGLTIVLEDDASTADMWLINKNDVNASVLIQLMYYTSNDPVPGGCNMEFPVEISPYLRLTDDQFNTYIQFQHANVGSPKHIDPPPCGSTLTYISYDIFVYFLKEHNFSEEEYFNGLQHMNDISFLHNSATKIDTYLQHPQTQVNFLKYPKTGAVYTVVAKYTINGIKREAAYVPSATYGCIIVSEDYGCGLPYTSATMPFLIVLSVCGLFIAFFGHRYFTTEMFFIGFLIALLVSFILLSKYNGLWTEKNTFVFSLLSGLFGGFIWMIIWILFRNPVISVLPVGFLIGFLLTCTMLYTPLGNSEVFINEKNYWLFISGGTAITAAMFLAFPKTTSIIGSSIIGSYSAVLVLDEYLGTSLIFIVINVIKRALSDKPVFAVINDVPFQASNIIVSSVWVTITLLAIILQTYVNWKNTKFSLPSCICLTFKYPGCTCSSSIQRDILITQPLLQGSHESLDYNSFR